MSVSPRVSVHSPKGVHYLLECSGIDLSILNDKDRLEKILCDGATAAGATVVESTIHAFNPHGLSGVIVIAESHIAIHTWPEDGYAAVDIFTCGEAIIAERIYENLIQQFKPEAHSYQVIHRNPPVVD